MSSILAIYNQNEQQDYLKSGYWNNYKWSICYSREKTLLPFIVNGSKYAIPEGASITEFKLLRLDYSNPTTVLETNNLSIGSIIIQVNAPLQNYIFYANDNSISSYDDGFYQYYIKDSAGNEFYSGFFCHKETGQDGGDFNDDFNEDFYIYDTTGMDLVKIEVSGLYGVYPNDFTDKVFLPYRMVKEPPKIINNITQDKHGSIYDNFVDQRVVQSVSYNAYSSNILMSESQNYENINSAKTVRITTSEGFTYFAHILEPIERELVDDKSYNSLFKLKFEDLNVENYINNNQPIINHFSSVNVLAENVATPGNKWELKMITLSTTPPTNLQEIYGGLTPKISSQSNNFTTTGNNGTVLIQSQNEKTVTAIFFLSETEARDLEENFYKADQIKLLKNSSGYQNLDYTSNAELTIEQGDLFDLYKATVKFTYDIDINTHLSSDLSDTNYKAKITVNSTDFYSNVLPIKSVSTDTGNIDVLEDGSNTLPSFTQKHTYVCKFYMNGTDANDFMDKMLQAKKTQATLTTSSFSINNAEFIIPEVRQIEGFQDLHEINIIFIEIVAKTFNYS